MPITHLAMLYLFAFAAIVCTWSLLLILSGERQRQVNQALAANSHPQPVAPAKKPVHGKK